MILRYFQLTEASKLQLRQKTSVTQNSYDSSSDDLDGNSNDPHEECDVNVDDLKIIDTAVDESSETDFESKPIVLKPPKDIIINATIAIIHEQNNSNKQPISNDLFNVDNSEFDGYREVDDYGYDQKKIMRGCKEVKRCRKACNRVHKTLCEEFNCDKLKVAFKQMCKEKCEKAFSDSDDDNESDYRYYDE